MAFSSFERPREKTLWSGTREIYFDVTCFYLLMNVCRVSLVKTVRGKLSFSETCADSSMYSEWVQRVQKFICPLLKTQS